VKSLSGEIVNLDGEIMPQSNQPSKQVTDPCARKTFQEEKWAS
jgi:hypothetical protein